MAILFDLVGRSTVRRVAAGTEIDRTFRVSDIIATPELVLLTALDTVGIPKVGDAYPGRPEYRARDIRGTVAPGDKPDAVFVVVTYSNKTGNTWNQEEPAPGNDGQDVKQVTTSTARRKVISDKDGNPMTIAPPSPKFDSYESYQSEAEESYAVANIVFERTETEPPSLRARNFVSKVNSDPINVTTPSPYVYPPRSLRFEYYDSRSVDGGRTWRATYEFGFNSRLWKHRDYWRTPDGRVPPEAVQVEFDTEDEADFNLLGLDWNDDQTPLP